jgi:hypothetical protein
LLALISEFGKCTSELSIEPMDEISTAYVPDQKEKDERPIGLSRLSEEEPLVAGSIADQGDGCSFGLFSCPGNSKSSNSFVVTGTMVDRLKRNSRRGEQFSADC